MALALAPHSIRVNAVGPGSIMTDILASVAADEAARNKLLSRIPMGRIGDPLEVGEVVAFLASPAASYITGAAPTPLLSCPVVHVVYMVCWRSFVDGHENAVSHHGCAGETIFVDGGRMALNYTVPVASAQ